MEGKYEIRRIPIWPVAKIAFIVFLIVGVIVAIIVSVIFSGFGFLAGILNESPFCSELMFLRNLGFIMIPAIAISSAIFGTIRVIIIVLVYNLVASIAGGVELTLRPLEEQRSRPPVGQGEAPDTAHVPDRPIDGF